MSFGSPSTNEEVWRKQLKAALGTVSDAFVDMSLHHLERAARMPGDGPSDMAINGALAHIAAFDAGERNGSRLGGTERLHAHGQHGDVRQDRWGFRPPLIACPVWGLQPPS